MAISEMMNFLIAALPSAPAIICKGKGGNSVSFANFMEPVSLNSGEESKRQERGSENAKSGKD
jgi:hypothetical protein